MAKGFKVLSWSQMQTGAWNGKVGDLTMFSVAFHAGFNAWYVFPKLPGLKSVKVKSEEEGFALAGRMYQQFLVGLEV